MPVHVHVCGSKCLSCFDLQLCSDLHLSSFACTVLISIKGSEVNLRKYTRKYTSDGSMLASETEDRGHLKLIQQYMHRGSCDVCVGNPFQSMYPFRRSMVLPHQTTDYSAAPSSRDHLLVNDCALQV